MAAVHGSRGGRHKHFLNVKSQEIQFFSQQKEAFMLQILVITDRATFI